MSEKKFRISTMNGISPLGLDMFPRDRYEVASDLPNPDALLVRSADLNNIEIPGRVKAIARAGAGYNNIPVEECSRRGIVVFNTPGANANAVKELVIAALILSSRDILGGANWAASLAGKADEIPDLAEKGKKQFSGPEIRGKTLAVVGLGAIGVAVAKAAVTLGMKVDGYDPNIPENVWKLPGEVEGAETLEGLLGHADYISLHLPLDDKTKGIFQADKFQCMKKGVRIINLARGGLVNEKDLIAALESGLVGKYVTDFPTAELLAARNTICLPHLGASTPEAEDNCAIMAVQQLRDFFEQGAIKNSVNFPHSRLEHKTPYRLLVANKNIPGMVAKMATILGDAGNNITGMINHEKGAYAYNIIDTSQEIRPEVREQIISIEGILRCHVIEFQADAGEK